MNATSWQNRTAEGVRVDRSITGSVSIPVHKRRLALQALASLAVTVFCLGSVLFGVLGKIPGETNPWHFVGTGFGAIGGLYGWLRGIWRLQNADAGLIVAPRGLTILAEQPGRRIGLIPWSAVLRFESRKRKGQPYVAVHLHEPRRLLAQRGPFRDLLYLLRSRLSGSPVTISPQLLRISPGDLETLLRRYLAHYGGTTG